MHFETGKPFNPYMLFHGLFIPNSIAMSYIPDSSKILLGRLMQFAGQNGKAFPTRRTLCQELCWSESKLNRNIRSLKDLKLIDTKILNEDSATSPNEYVFLYNEMYATPIATPPVNSDKGSIQDHTTEPTPPVTDDKGPPVTDDKHNRISSIESPINYSSKEESRPSDSNSVDDQPLEYNGMLCSLCNEPQFSCKSGDTCINGHGGVEGIEKEEIAPKSIFPAKLKRIVKTPNPFGYTPQALKIITYWEKCGGKIHYLKTSGNGLDKIKNFIEELLMQGLNTCYSKYTRDQELKMKQWTVEEILSSINVYANIQNKAIDKMYFTNFVEMIYHGNVSRNFRNHSPLLDSFKNIPDEATEKWQTLLRKKFKELYPSLEINSTVLLNCAKFLVNQDKVYQVINGASVGYHIVNLYVSYIRKIVTESGTQEPLKYMSGQDNLDKFITYSLTKSFKLKKRSKLA